LYQVFKAKPERLNLNNKIADFASIKSGNKYSKKKEAEVSRLFFKTIGYQLVDIFNRTFVTLTFICFFGLGFLDFRENE
jgi:hypothetical protein